MRWHLPTESAREQSVAKRLRASSKFYRFLWEIRGELFADGFEEVLIESYEPRGQEPCPPAQLAMAMLLQRYEGQSDAGAVDAAENDRRWQLVLGTLGEERAPFGQGSMVRFRVRMIANDLDKKLGDRTIKLAKRSGKFGWKKLRVALDSSPLEGAGRVEEHLESHWARDVEGGERGEPGARSGIGSGHRAGAADGLDRRERESGAGYRLE